MTIVSITYIIFVVAVVAAYYITPKKYRWITLLAASFVFYFLNSKWLLFVMIATSLFTFFIGKLISDVNSKGKAYIKEKGSELSKDEKKAYKEKTKRRARSILTIGIIVDVLVLLFLKYHNFFAENANGLFSLIGLGKPIPLLGLLLPLGISFYTLQAIAYMTDIYRGKIDADTNPAKFLLFMSFFPQIVQGPIPRHAQLANQLYEGHDFDYERFCFGWQLLLWGLIKKLVIAERLAMPVNELFGNHTEYSGPILFVAALLYGIQIYADFSGGMDIVRGVAQMMGIDLELNFTQPFFAKSIEDFWRRWHITMGAWMRDYVFYPLSLSKAFTNLSRNSRKLLGQYVGKRLPSFLAMFIVYFLVGFWHGPNWKYIVFGLWNGVFIMVSILLENTYSKSRDLLKINENVFSFRVFRMVRTLIIVSFGRYFSRAADLPTALSMLRSTFSGFSGISKIPSTIISLCDGKLNIAVLGFAILILFAVGYLHEKGYSIRSSIAKQGLVVRWAVYLAAVVFLLICGIYGPGYDASAFIYQQF